jgi:hypothetical protein
MIRFEALNKTNAGMGKSYRSQHELVNIFKQRDDQSRGSGRLLVREGLARRQDLGSWRLGPYGVGCEQRAR